MKQARIRSYDANFREKNEQEEIAEQERNRKDVVALIRESEKLTGAPRCRRPTAKTYWPDRLPVETWRRVFSVRPSFAPNWKNVIPMQEQWGQISRRWTN